MRASDHPETGQTGRAEVEALSIAERWMLGVALMLACALIAVAERLPNPGTRRSLPRPRRSRPLTGAAAVFPERTLPRCVHPAA